MSFGDKVLGAAAALLAAGSVGLVVVATVSGDSLMQWGCFAAMASLLGVVLTAVVRDDRRLRALASSPLATMAPGASGGAGRVVPVGPLVLAPVSGRSCVGYRWAVTRSDSDGTPSAWRTKLRPFWIADETARVLVDATDNSDLQASDYESEVVGEAVSRLESLLGLVPLTLGTCGRVTYRESTVRPGDVVTVDGWAEIVIDPRGDGGPSSRAVPTCLSLRATKKVPLRIFPSARSPTGARTERPGRP